jgi:hypothetical protein
MPSAPVSANTGGSQTAFSTWGVARSLPPTYSGRPSRSQREIREHCPGPEGSIERIATNKTLADYIHPGSDDNMITVAPRW